MPGWNNDLRVDIRHALKLQEDTYVGIDRACMVFADALTILPEDEILLGCRAWKYKRPGRRVVPEKGCDALLNASHIGLIDDAKFICPFPSYEVARARCLPG